MDPDATLYDLLWIANKVQRNLGYEGDYSQDMAALIITLDEWITKGGFLPERWKGKEQ